MDTYSSPPNNQSLPFTSITKSADTLNVFRWKCRIELMNGNKLYYKRKGEQFEVKDSVLVTKEHDQIPISEIRKVHVYRQPLEKALTIGAGGED